MSSISQSQRSTLLSASLLHTDWLNPVRSLARGGGEEASGEGEGEGGGLLFTEGVDEHENDNAERESRGEDTPFLFDLRPSPAAAEGEERGGTGGTGGQETDPRLDVSRCHIFHPEPESCRSGSGRPPSCLACSRRLRTESAARRSPSKNQER